ncbi:phage tail protein [Pantoea sp. ME81]|uniref:phage tail protein n=1 Tax=Pantoea sp. ME81 TaxID=2743935 RepID=UPI0015F71124|nr:phage tail protein [Pantoea sp. ME81]
MDRQIVYPGSIPLETDLLNTNKYAMIGLAKLAAAMMGTTTYLRGLTCTPSSPASMVVNVARGEIYSVQNVDNSAYSSLAADTTNTILKQGIVMSSTAFTLTAPTTAGQSINYLIQVTYSDTDSGATVLPYYNAVNPSVAYSGPNNSGTAQNTVRSGVCTVAIKAGVAATTGTQTTPSVDTGYTAAWVITVAQGATTVTAANISTAANAPFLPVAGLVAAVQQNSMTYAADTGAANAYVAQFVPAIPTLADGMRFTFKAKIANTGASTFAANGGSAYPLYSHAHQALQGGEIIANGLIEVEWNSTLMAWVLCGNSGGALPVGAATQSNHAMQFGQATGRLLNIQTFTASGTYTPTPGTTMIEVELVGGSGGTGGCAATSSTTTACTSPGCQGTYALARYSNPTTTAITIGAGGSPGGTSGQGSTGGTSTFGSLLSCPGGQGSYAVTPTNGTITSATGASSAAPTGSGIVNSLYGRGVPNAIQASFGVATNYTAPAQGPFPGTSWGASVDGVYRGASQSAYNGNTGLSGGCRIREFA